LGGRLVQASMQTISLRGVAVEEQPGGLTAVFTLSDTPESGWVALFRERSAYSNFDFTAATFRRNLLRVELPFREELPSLIDSVEGLIAAANTDHDFHRRLRDTGFC
jgi:hypothetical protein